MVGVKLERLEYELNGSSNNTDWEIGRKIQDDVLVDRNIRPLDILF